MREYNINIPPGSGLKPNVTAIGGHNLLSNLKCEERYWSVPKALDMTLGEGQLLRGRGVTLLWRAGTGEEPEEPELPEGAIAIANVDQLQGIGTSEGWEMDGYYYLVNDIDASETAEWNDGAGFLPIGNIGYPFAGTFDGRGHVISGLVIDRPTMDYVGLFAIVGAGAAIKNVRLDGGVTTGSDQVGGLAGLNAGLITNCCSSGTVTGIYNVGGLVGTTILALSSSYATTGTVTGKYVVGGLAGYNTNAVTSCYATGAVTGIEQTGGLVGVDAGTVTSSYYDTETTGQSDTGKGTPQTTAIMQTQATFLGWDFADVWDIDEGNGYPTLRVPDTDDEPVSWRDGFYTVNETDLSTTILFNTPMAGRWQMADYGDFVILTDGTHTWTITSGVPAAAWVVLDSVCAFDARLFYAIGGAAVARYSMVAGEDIPSILAGVDINIDERDFSYNEEGAMLLPFRGKVLSISRLGEAIIYYGEDGIVALTEALDMPALREIQGLPPGIGLRGRAAVDGTLDQHVFLGSDGALWSLDARLQAQRLDYAWTLTEEDRVVFDPVNQEYWVGPYLLTKYGLGGPMDQEPTSIIVVDGAPVATGTPYASGDDGILPVSVLLHTGTFDMNQNGQKRLSVVNLNGEISYAYVKFLYRYDTGTVYRERPGVRCSPEGAAFLNAAFVYGQLKIAGLAQPENRLTRIEVRYQAHDRRFCRGTRGFQNVPGDDNSGA